MKDKIIETIIPDFKISLNLTVIVLILEAIKEPIPKPVSA